MAVILAGLAAMMVALPALAAFLDRHDFEVPRERDERVEGRFTIALGTVSIGEAGRGRLFQARVDMEDSRLIPSLDVRRDGGVAHLRLGLDDASRGGISFRGLRNRSQNQWRLLFDRRTPLDLTFDLGLASADLDFDGFRVENLRVTAGMADSRIAFGRRNPIEMEHLHIEAGASRFVTERLGNARFRQMTFTGGAGSFVMDFSGARLPAGAKADIDVGVSRLVVRLPEDRPVVLHAPDSWLTRVDVPSGYTSRTRGLCQTPRPCDV